MQYARKRLLAYSGLAAVLAITTVAVALPSNPASATDESGATVTYSVEINNPLQIEVGGGDGENPTVTVTPDPDATVSTENEIANYEYTVTDENGETVYGPFTRDVLENGETFEIPFDELGLPSGEYTLTIVGYNQDGDTVATYVYTFTYTAPIYAPDTGTLTIGSLQIAHADYWALGILCALIAGGVGFALHRRSRKQKA